MKRKVKETYQTQGTEELTKRVRELEQQLKERQLSKHTNPAKNTRNGKALKKEIAFIKTVQRMREIAK